MSLRDRVVRLFEQQFAKPPGYVVRAPGRVNLIGEHTDYNDGFVLPMAIDRATWMALSPRQDRQVVAVSLNFEQRIAFELDGLQRGSASAGQQGWAEYLKGVAWVLQEAGHVMQGWEGVLASNVPIGAGLSSSAALELATARAFAAVADLPWAPAEMARLAQRAENEWVGLACGIMDQMIAATGKAGHAVLIDTRSLETELVPLPQDTAVVVLDTATRRGLVDSAYNERRAQCEAAAAFFGVPALRDVSQATFEARAVELDDVTRRRARHVITENARTLAAASAMRRNEPQALGRLMDASHESLRDDFEVSSPQLDRMVQLARSTAGCYGARMTGAGFGGCAVALVRGADAQRFAQSVAERYEEAEQRAPAIYICEAENGAEVVLAR